MTTHITPPEILEMADQAFFGLSDDDPWDVVALVIADLLDSVDLALRSEDVSAEIRIRVINVVNDYYAGHYT